MWFFTDKGVSKFDGQNFKNFTGFDGLSEHEAYFGYEDSRGRLWLYEKDGNLCFIKNDTAYNAGNNKLLEKLPIMGPFIQQMIEGKDSSLYICYKFGQVLKIDHDHFFWVIRDKSVRDVFTWSISMKEDTGIIHTTTADIRIEKDRIVSVSNVPANSSFTDAGYFLTSDAQGVKIYNNGILTFSCNDTRFTIKSIIHLYFDKKDHLFCGTNNGLYIINIKTRKVNLLFNNIKVTCATQDLYGNYWISSIGNGIYCLDKNLDAITLLNVDENYKMSTAQNGQIFFSKDNSFYYVKDSLIKIEKLDLGNIVYRPIYISDKYFFYKDATSSFCLIRSTGEICPLEMNISRVYEAGNDTFLIIGFTDIYTATIEKNKLTVVRNIYTRHLLKAYFDKEHKTVYYTHDSDKNLHRYNLISNTINVVDRFNKYQSIENLYLISGNIALLTNDRHINIYDTKNGDKKTTIDQLPFVLYEIFNSANNYILSTNRGYYYCPDNNKQADMSTLIYDYKVLAYPFKSPDLLSLNIADDRVICNLNGNYYICNDSLLRTEYLVPRLFIDSILVNGKRYNPDDKPEIHNHARTNISIHLSALKFNNLVSNFEYRIIRSDTSQWYTSTSGDLEILFEKYGDYCIEMRGRTENKLVSNSLYFVLKVFPPFYYSLPFYIIVGICIGLLTIAIVRYYNKKRRKIFENELAYLQLEHKAINSLLNPHFIFNAINNIQNLVNVNSNNVANKYLAILSKLVRQNIENLQFNFIPIDKELSLIKNYIHLQNLRFDNKITLIINNLLGDTDSIHIQIPPLLIHTFVENSVIHGFKKDIDNFVIEIELSLSTDDYLIITIKDNGAGLSDTKTESVISDKTSLGIDFMRKRLARISDFYKVVYSLEINNRRDSKGVEVLIVLSGRFSNNVAKRNKNLSA